MQSFGGPFHSKMTWAGTGLVEGCNRRKCVLWFVHWNWVHIDEVPDVCNWIWFCRYFKDWKYKDLKLKWCRQRICCEVRRAGETWHRSLIWLDVNLFHFRNEITWIHYWNQSVENSTLSSPLGCDFVTSLIIQTALPVWLYTKMTRS